jgi:hypothetical protein
MKIEIPIVILFLLTIVGCATQTVTVAKLDFPLPPHARYTITDQQFGTAKALLEQNFSSDTNRLKTIVSSPCMCGPELWHLVKDSPHFSTPPHTKTTIDMPSPDGKTQKLSAALIQDAAEADNFRAALADLLSANGSLIFRLPNEEEFRKFWAVTPFDEISEPLIVAEGSRYSLIIEFADKRPFWFEEVKNMTFK